MYIDLQLTLLCGIKSDDLSRKLMAKASKYSDMRLD